MSEDVRTGCLVPLLEQFEGESTPLHLVCPHRKQFSPAVQQLHRLLRQRCDTLAGNLPTATAPRAH